MRYGLKGSELKEKSFKSDEELANHLEEHHGIIVTRNGETKEKAIERCAKKGIVSDRTKCSCFDCKEWRRISRGNL